MSTVFEMASGFRVDYFTQPVIEGTWIYWLLDLRYKKHVTILNIFTLHIAYTNFKNAQSHES